jgi:hypothetical protein
VPSTVCSPLPIASAESATGPCPAMRKAWIAPLMTALASPVIAAPFRSVAGSVGA